MTETPLLDYLIAVPGAIMAPALGDSGLARRAARQALDAYAPANMREAIVSGKSWRSR